MLTPVPSAPLSSVAYTIFMIVNGLDLGVCSLFRYWFAAGKQEASHPFQAVQPFAGEHGSVHESGNDCSMPALAEHAFI